MDKKFTGYIIKDDYDLSNLPKDYGFYKTEPKRTNPWYQHPFNITWGAIGTWESELLVSKNDRRLLMRYEEGCKLDSLEKTIEKMKQDGILVWHSDT